MIRKPIRIQRAAEQHAEGISRVCSEGWRDTYKDIYPTDYIERTIEEFYNLARIRNEITEPWDGWDGWFVALDGDEVVGAIGGGMIGPEEAEVFVLYLLPSRRREGIGTKLLGELSGVQRAKGAKRQWVSVMEGNRKGIPFYEAQGFKPAGVRKVHQSREEEDFRSLRYVREL